MHSNPLAAGASALRRIAASIAASVLDEMRISETYGLSGDFRGHAHPKRPGARSRLHAAARKAKQAPRSNRRKAGAKARQRRRASA